MPKIGCSIPSALPIVSVAAALALSSGCGNNGASTTQNQNYDLFLTQFSTSGTKQWTAQSRGDLVLTATAVTAVTDSNGNILVSGTTVGALDGNVLHGSYDSFVMKFNPSGSKQWTQQMGVTGTVTTSAGVALDGLGNIYVGGWTTGGLDGNSRVGTSDLYVTQYVSSGAKQWTRQLGNPGTDTAGWGLGADASGNVLITGRTSGGLDGNSLTGHLDMFVTKYNSSGTKQWTRQLGTAGQTAIGQAVATDSSGNVFVVGQTSGGLDGNTLVGTIDMYLTKYTSSGVKQWTQELGTAGQTTSAFGVAVDASGNIVITGWTKGGLDGNTLAGTEDFFVTKYNSAGTKQWTRQLGVAGQITLANGIAVDGSNNIYIAGSTTGGLDGNTLTGTRDAFVTQYSSAGAKQWTKQLGVTGKDTAAYSVTTDSSGHVYMAGGTQGGLDGNTYSGN